MYSGISAIILIAIAFYLNAAFAQTDEKKKLAELVAKMAKTPVIRLTDATFAKYITERPRSYNALLMLTAEAPDYGCSICPGAASNVETIAAITNEQIDFKTTNPQNRIIYFIADFDSCPNLFRTLKVNTVPRTYLLPPASASDPKFKMSDYPLGDEVTNLQSLIAVVSKKINNSKLAPSYPPAPFLVFLIIVAVFIAYVTHKAAEDFDTFIRWYRSPFIWFLISLLCFGVGVSGSISCIIRSAPFYGRDRKSFHLFSGGSREQFLAEGIIVALWTIGCAFSLVFSFLGTKVPIPPIRHVLVILGMAMFIVFSQQLWNAYIDKTQWYNLKDTIPSNVWTWLFSGLKKSSGIVKRLFRLSEVYLTEYKDLKSFEKKARLILIDYLQRMYENILSSIGQIKK